MLMARACAATPWAVSVKVVYESERVILARALRDFGDRDHLVGFD
jgi:hypothetical protein